MCGTCPSVVAFTVQSYLGVNTTTTRNCSVQQRVFRWDMPLTYGGYRGQHCFYATDTCGADPGCAGRPAVALCVELAVAKCRYAVQLESTVVEVAALFGSDWIQACVCVGVEGRGEGGGPPCSAPTVHRRPAPRRPTWTVAATAEREGRRRTSRKGGAYVRVRGKGD